MAQRVEDEPVAFICPDEVLRVRFVDNTSGQSPYGRERGDVAQLERGVEAMNRQDETCTTLCSFQESMAVKPYPQVDPWSEASPHTISRWR